MRADETDDRAQVVEVLLDSGHSEAVALRVKAVARHGPPEHMLLLRRAVVAVGGTPLVPHLREAQRHDEERRPLKHLARAPPRRLGRQHHRATRADPQVVVEILALERPLKLLAEHEGVHQPGRALQHRHRRILDVRVARAAPEIVVHRVAARAQPQTHLIGEARAERGDELVAAAADERALRRPALQHEGFEVGAQRR